MVVSTYSGNSSNDLTECKGELGSFLCTSTSFLILTSLLLDSFIKKESSTEAVPLVSSVEERQCTVWDFSIDKSIIMQVLRTE